MFHDRADAGRRLAAALAPLKLASPVVFALPRGGVPVAAEVAERLACSLRVLVVRKVGHPGHTELALGAIVDGEPPIVVRNESLLAECGIDDATFDALVEQERPELVRRRRMYAAAPLRARAGATAIVVDDGLATGATARAALAGLRQQGWEHLVLAVPVAPADALRQFDGIADRVVCPIAADRFSGVGGFYDDFHQVPDREVLECLGRFKAAD